MNMSECNSYEEQCKKWHNELLNEFMINNTMNLKERLNEIEDIVNEECSQYVSSLNHYNIGINLFKITEPERNNLLDLYNANLREHTVVSYEKCTKQMNNRDDYKKKARNKLNRWKPKVYGDNVLYQIIFINMYNYCYTIGRNHEWDDNEILYLFITIFIKLLTSKIRFKKTRDVPLILSTAFSTNTKFRSSCIYFLQHFNELKSWDDKSGRAKDKCDSFKKCLEKLKNIQYSIVIPPPIICEYMDIQENNRTCKGGYQFLITEIIIKLEDEENCNKDERISECGTAMETINEYHHYNIKFWTVTPEKPSRLLYKYSTYNDNDYNINRYDNDSNDDDGDFAIICGKGDDMLQIPPPISSGIVGTDIYSNSYNLYGNNNNNNNEQQQLPEIDLSMTIGSTSGNSCDFSVASHTTYTSTKSGNNNNYNAVNSRIFNNSHTLNNNPTLNNNHTFNNNHSFNNNGNNFSVGYKASRGSPNYCRNGISHDPLYAPQAAKLKQHQQRQQPRFLRVSSRDSIPDIDKIPPINDDQYVYNNCGPGMELISNNNYIQAAIKRNPPIQRNPPITQQLPRPTRQFIINDNFQEPYNNCIGNNGGYRNNYNNDNHYQSRNPPLSRELPIPHTFNYTNINNNNNRNNNFINNNNNMLVTNNPAINFNLSNRTMNVNQQPLNNMCQLTSTYNNNNNNTSNANNNSNKNYHCNNNNNQRFENRQQFIYCNNNNINSNNNGNQEMQFDEYNIDSNQYSQFNEDNDCNQFIMTQEMQMDPRSNNIRYFVNNHSMNNHNMNNHNMNNSNYGQYGNNR